MVGICILLCFWLVDWIELLCREMLMCRLIDREFNFAEKYLKLFDFMTMVRIWKEFLSQGSLKRWNVTPSNYSKVALIGWMNSSIQRVEMLKVKLFIFSIRIWCSSFYNVVLIDDVEDEIMKHRKWEFDKKKKWGKVFQKYERETFSETHLCYHAIEHFLPR